jgi:Holliday junction resolvase RusA-like endonuclease
MILYIVGNPIALKRPRFTRFGHTYDSQKAEKQAVIMQMKTQKICFYPIEPLKIIMDFCFKRPKSHYYTGKNSDKLKTTAPVFVGKPDIDNLIKFYLDCMNGLVFKDDSQVIKIAARKQYTENPYVMIEIVEVING